MVNRRLTSQRSGHSLNKREAQKRAVKISMCAPNLFDFLEVSQVAQKGQTKWSTLSNRREAGPHFFGLSMVKS